MILRPPRSTPLYSSAASDVYKRQPSDVAFERVKVSLRNVHQVRHVFVQVDIQSLCIDLGQPGNRTNEGGQLADVPAAELRKSCVELLSSSLQRQRYSDFIESGLSRLFYVRQGFG